MNSKLTFLLLISFLSCATLFGQFDQLRQSEETARRLDSLENRERPERENNDSRENNDLSRQWDRLIGLRMAKFKESMDYFDTPETRCLFIMVIYLDTYMDIVETTYEANDCKTKSDGYAMQALAIGAVNTIIYCPESLANKTVDEKNHIWHEDLKPILENEDNRNSIYEWEEKLKRVVGTDGDILNNRIDALTAFFHPNNIIAKLLNIQQNLEELNCPD